MTTPEQLAKWREDARAEYLNDDNIRVEDIAEEHYVAGYLRAKQETEQVMKLAKFGAMVLFTYKEGYVSDEEIGNFALSSGCITQPIEAYAPNIEATIKELLK